MPCNLEAVLCGLREIDGVTLSSDGNSSLQRRASPPLILSLVPPCSGVVGLGHRSGGEGVGARARLEARFIAKLRGAAMVAGLNSGDAWSASSGSRAQGRWSGWLRAHYVEGTRSRTLRDPGPTVPTCSRQGKRGFAWGKRR
jgi:hypothetical protein